MVLVSGREVYFALTLLFSLVVLFFFILIDRKKEMPYIRRISALDAIEEAVGRCAELGKPLFYSAGQAQLYTDEGQQTIAGISIASYVASLTARYNVRIIPTIVTIEGIPLLDAIGKDAYVSEGKNPDDFEVYFISHDIAAYVTGAIGTIEREKPGAVLQCGQIWIREFGVMETANLVGAITIAGTTRIDSISVYACVCDYVMIGDELLAGGAYVSEDPAQVGSIVGADYNKMIVIALIIIGVILASLGSDWLRNLLG